MPGWKDAPLVPLTMLHSAVDHHFNELHMHAHTHTRGYLREMWFRNVEDWRRVQVKLV